MQGCAHCVDDALVLQDSISDAASNAQEPVLTQLWRRFCVLQ